MSFKGLQSCSYLGNIVDSLMLNHALYYHAISGYFAIGFINAQVQ